MDEYLWEYEPPLPFDEGLYRECMEAVECGEAYILRSVGVAAHPLQPPLYEPLDWRPTPISVVPLASLRKFYILPEEPVPDQPHIVEE